jgi:two-component system, cell cycle sensor histidine kinase and response regulator CckA
MARAVMSNGLPLSTTLAAALAAALLLGVGAHASRGRPGILWSAAWVVVLLAGAVLALGPATWGPQAAVFLLPLFPGALLAGALAMARGRAPAWLAPVALLLGVLRVAASAGPLAGVELVVTRVLQPAGMLAAGIVVFRDARGREPSAAHRWLPFCLGAAGLFFALVAWTHHPSQGLRMPMVLAGAAAALLCVPLQLRVFQRWRARDEDGARRRAELALRESEERYRALAESAFDLVAELDGNERFTYVNRRYEEVLGRRPEELLGLRPVDLVHPEDMAAAARFAQQAAETGHARGLVVRGRRGDGSFVWLESVARSFLAPDGQRRWVMNSRDISDRKQAEELRERVRERLEEAIGEQADALRASEARFRALTDHAPEIISEFDGRGRYTFANEAFRELLGYDPVELVGTSPQQLIHPDDVLSSRESLIHALRHEAASRAVHRLRHADGSWRWFDNTGRAYRTASGELRFVSVGRDVTEARKAEAERRRLEEQVHQMQRLESLGVMAGGIAHDFNNLLAVILGNVDLLEAAANLDPELRERMQRIRSAARHAEALTDQMLAYAGRSVSSLVPVDLSAMVRDTLGLLRAGTSAKCALAVDLAAEPPWVRGDPTKLRQVLVNLVRNAAEALGDDGGEIRLRTGTCQPDPGALAGGLGAADRSHGTWAFLEVADDGPGMDEAVRQRAFEPFFTTKRSGRGLGLAAVLGIATSHGGVLQLDTAPDRGCRFRLLVPPCEAPRREALEALRAVDAEPPALPLQGEASEAPRGRVLVVDDDEAVREVGQRFLEAAGIAVEACSGGREALARLRREPPLDAVLLDLGMPDVSGADVLWVIREELPDLPVVVVSGYRRDLASERLRGAEPFALLEKPYDAEELVAVLGEALGSPRRG